MRHRQTHRQVVKRYRDAQQQKLSRGVGQLAVSRCQLPNRNRIRRRSVFEERNEIVSHWRQRDAKSLWENDATKGEYRAHAKQVRCFPLTARNRFESSAINLRFI